MASPNAGGFVELTINGVPYSAVGDVEVEESNTEPEAVVNQDGTVQVTVKPKPFKVMLTLRDRQGPSIVRALYSSAGGVPVLDLVSREKHMKRTVFMTGSFATGSPKRNTATGEISGIEICGGAMRIVDI